MIILGLAGSKHDASATIISEGKVLAACEEERYSRIKHAPGQLPINAAKACMRIAGISPGDIDITTYYFHPHFYTANIGPFLKRNAAYFEHMDSGSKKRIFGRGRNHIEKAKRLIRELGLKNLRYTPHHLAHAASSFYLSGFNDAMILSVDNIGELTSTMLAAGEGTEIRVINEQEVPHSLGMLYTAITDFLGFKPFCDEGKIMALASYGTPNIPLEEIVEIKEGGFELKVPFTNLSPDSRREFSDELVKKYGEPRLPEEPLTKRHFDIAASVQKAITETMKRLVTWMHKRTGLKNLCLAGGVALNCSANGELRKLPFIENIYVFPAAGDAGTSLGSAVYEYVRQTGKLPVYFSHAGLGEAWSNAKIRDILKISGFRFKEIEDPAIEAGKKISEDGVICWFNGRAEFGPRALGHRSILALPDSLELRDSVNREIKHREVWRPFGPSITCEGCEDYAMGSSNGRFMIITYDATDYAKRRIPGAIHLDNTMRVQTVYPEECQAYYELLNHMGQLTGNPVLLNTSFNLKGEPIANSPINALDSFLKMPVRSMIIENFMVEKNG